MIKTVQRAVKLQVPLSNAKSFCIWETFDWAAFIAAAPWTSGHPRYPSALERGLDRLGGRRVGLGEFVAVDVERGRHAGVADAPAHGQRIDPARDQRRGMAVTQGVEAHPRELARLHGSP